MPGPVKEVLPSQHRHHRQSQALGTRGESFPFLAVRAAVRIAGEYGQMRIHRMHTSLLKLSQHPRAVLCRLQRHDQLKTDHALAHPFHTGSHKAPSRDQHPTEPTTQGP